MRALRSLVVVVGACLVLSVARTRGATPITVTSGADAGPGTLRAALASATTSGDTIAFASSLAGLTITLTTTDALTTTPSASPGPPAPFGTTALVVYGKDVTIDGSGAPGLTISGGDTQRIFAVTGLGGSGPNPPTTQGVLRLVNVTLAHGLAKGGNGGGAPGSIGGGGGAAGLGGAVFVDGGSKAVLRGCLFSACKAQGGDGGEGNTGTALGGAGGGGLSGDGSPGVVSGNFGPGGPPNGGLGSGPGGFGGGGGGGNPAIVIVGDGGFGGGGGGGPSTGGGGAGGGSGGFGGGGGGFEAGFGGGGGGTGTGGFGAGDGGQDASGSGGCGGGGGLGGGGAVFVKGGALEATNCTFTGCWATGGIGGGSVAGVNGGAGQGLGGAIFLLSGSAAITFSTLVNNMAATDGGALYALALGGTTTVTLKSSILATPAPNDPVATSVLGGTLNVSGDHNLIPAPGGLTPQPLLGALSSNGGPTQTCAVTSASTAIDAGDATLVALAPPAGAGGVDQRGSPRRTGVTNIGAFELQPKTVAVVSGGNQSALAGAAFANAVVLLVKDENGEPLRGATVVLSPPASGASASFLPSPLVTDATSLVFANGTANGTQGGPYSVTATVGSASTTFQLTNAPPSGGPSPPPPPSSPPPGTPPAPAPPPGITPDPTFHAHHRHGGCALGPDGRGSPADLAPFALVLVTFVVLRRRALSGAKAQRKKSPRSAPASSASSLAGCSIRSSMNQLRWL